MIFNEIYSVYYQTVSKILTAACQPDVTEKKLQDIVNRNAFSESVLTILPSLKSGKWPLLKEDLSPVFPDSPALPLTNLEKSWLKSLCGDPRLSLFGVEFPEYAEVSPLFTRDDYRIYDQYADGDPYDDPDYMAHFRLILSAIREKRPVIISMTDKFGKKLMIPFIPVGLEYSAKDDKIRVITEKCKYRTFNLARIESCRYYEGSLPDEKEAPAPQKRKLVIQITDTRNTLERAMLHFSHFEKQAERLSGQEYELQLWYYEPDENELIIRILSFGPWLKVVEPEGFIQKIRKKLLSQKSCE